LCEQAKRLAKAILSSTTELPYDENLLFFLLRHHHDFDQLHGKGTIAKLFSKLSPKGAGKAIQFMTQKYQNRGFDHLLPIIRQKSAELGV